QVMEGHAQAAAAEPLAAGTDPGWPGLQPVAADGLPEALHTFTAAPQAELTSQWQQDGSSWPGAAHSAPNCGAHSAGGASAAAVGTALAPPPGSVQLVLNPEEGDQGGLPAAAGGGELGPAGAATGSVAPLGRVDSRLPHSLAGWAQGEAAAAPPSTPPSQADGQQWGAAQEPAYLAAEDDEAALQGHSAAPWQPDPEGCQAGGAGCVRPAGLDSCTALPDASAATASHTSQACPPGSEEQPASSSPATGDSAGPGLDQPPLALPPDRLLGSACAFLQQLVEQARSSQAPGSETLGPALPLIQLLGSAEVRSLLGLEPLLPSPAAPPCSAALLSSAAHHALPGTSPDSLPSHASSHTSSSTCSKGAVLEEVGILAAHALSTHHCTSNGTGEVVQACAAQLEAWPGAAQADRLAMSGKGQQKEEVEEQMAQAAQQRLEEQVAAVRQELQAELATRLQDQERECEARCVRLRQELAAGYEARIAAAEAELARTQQESEERGAELDELMACLGMAEEKCAALSDALIAAGKDADAIVAAVEDKYMSMPKDDELGVDLM
ncbi:hypothetical protein V8C86DRAFT_2972975, partial [Haematococcus lacustris]